MTADVAAWVLADLRSTRDLLNRIADLDTESDAERDSYRHMAQGVDVAIESVREMASSGLVASPAFKTPAGGVK